MAADTPVPLSSLVRMQPRFFRSVNLQRDARSTEALSAYVLSPHALQSLRRLFDGIRLSQYAWTLTGPYGSGKSLFALFLSSLLCRQHHLHSLAVNKLSQADAMLAEMVSQLPDFRPILVVGRRASPARCIIETLLLVPDVPPKLRRECEQLLAGVVEERVLEEAAIRYIEQLHRFWNAPLLLVIDEMGKPLEYVALHPELGDLFLLQQLAEMAPQLPMLLIGILHQAFENYAHQLEQITRREWTKVQGRFEDIPFVESAEQLMRLAAYAIEPQVFLHSGGSLCQSLAEHIAEKGLLPPTMRPQEFVELARRAYPLHPMTLMVLPHLFRRHAQNERSLFAFLAANEPYGFQEFLNSHVLSPVSQENMPLFGVHNLFDYIVANFRGALYSSFRVRPIAEAEQILQRESWSESEVSVMKSIAVMQWVSEVSHLRPNIDVLSCALLPSLSDSHLEHTLQKLRRRSAIVYRAFDQTYRIWQGSDIDIEEVLQQARRCVAGEIRLATLMREFLTPTPVVARRHSHKTGVLRIFEVRYLDAQDIETGCSLAPPAEGYAGVLLVCLPENHAQVRHLVEWALSSTAQNREIVVAVPQETVRLYELCKELLSLQYVQQNTPELRGDPVARRELRERTDSVKQAIRQQVQYILRSCQWFYAGQERWTHRSLSAMLSDVCDELYSQAPVLSNELINRWILSSAASAGRRNLIEAMLTRSHEERLGINGYPPERSMYESVLRVTGLHAPQALSWGFQEPPEDDPARLRPLWQRMQQLIFTDPPQPINIAELQQQLARPPYGLAPGVFPIILCAFLQVYIDETTLYREGTFLPQPSIADWEVLLRRPELFAVAGCRTDGPRARVLERIAKSWNVAPKTVPVVRELVRRLRSLPEHAWRTRRLPPQALALREAVAQARSPERLLFFDIPAALGVEIPPQHSQSAEQEIERFFEALNSALRALSEVTPQTILWARDELLRAFGLPEGWVGWRLFRSQAAVLRDRVSHEQLRPLLVRAAAELCSPPAHPPTGSDSEPADSDDEVLESVLAYVAGRPPRSWTDADVERFPRMALTFGELYRQTVVMSLKDIPLTREEEQQRDQLLHRLRQVLYGGISPRVRLSALLRLLTDLEEEA
jgi:hypothetical protein